jgi:hypothetical protein
MQTLVALLFLTLSNLIPEEFRFGILILHKCPTSHNNMISEDGLNLIIYLVSFYVSRDTFPPQCLSLLASSSLWIVFLMN